MLKVVKIGLLVGTVLSIVFVTCSNYNEKLLNLIKSDDITKVIKESYKNAAQLGNVFYPDIHIHYYDSILKLKLSLNDRISVNYELGNHLLAKGDEVKAIKAYESATQMLQDPLDSTSSFLVRKIALSYLRIGEKENCINSHSGESCIIPFKGTGIHQNPTGSNKAIKILESILNRNPDDYESMWLLNIAYMTTGKYPIEVPKKFLIPNLYQDPQKSDINAFIDIAPQLGIHSNNLAGGVIIEDFDGDNLLDVVTSEWNENGKLHYYKNNGVNGFEDRTEESGLNNVYGGLNINHVDYNNDGYFDLFILRGAWLNDNGKIPNSLLRNKGNGTFVDVTIETELLSFKPTQTAIWRDFNKDGWVDLFIGNENSVGSKITNSCELFLNSSSGKFKEVAKLAGCEINSYVKGVGSGDYNNDGLEDLYISTLYATNKLLKNIGIVNGVPTFKDVTVEAKVGILSCGTFPTWFWDYNNDGWLDIFVSGYSFGVSLTHSACTDALNIPNKASKLYLFLNNKDGTFLDVSTQSGLNKSVFSMGANFGDINNDGYLDMYLATGNPDLESLLPNKLYINKFGSHFEDVTVSARVGNIQKGHGVGISDLDNDGDQDIFVEIGGAYPSDVYHNALYINPGQNNNHWTHIRLEGVETNRSAIGSKLKLIIHEAGKRREIHRDVCSGGSFGSSSYRSDIGLGSARQIDSLIVTWQRTGTKQIFTNIPADKSIFIKENNIKLLYVNEPKVTFKGDSTKIPLCKAI